jgi:hypothetical protein
MVFRPDMPEEPYKKALGNFGDGETAHPSATARIVRSQSSTASVGFALPSNRWMDTGSSTQMVWKVIILGDEKTEFGIHMAYIFIEGATQTDTGPGDRNKYVPHKNIDIGPDWQPDISRWAISLDAPPDGVWYRPPPVIGNDKFAKTVVALIQAFVYTRADFVGVDIKKVVSKHSIKDVAGIILTGI